MRTTVTIDDDLLEKAEALTQIKERRALIREALQVLIAVKLQMLGWAIHAEKPYL